MVGENKPLWSKSTHTPTHSHSGRSAEGKINNNKVFSSICTCQWHLLSGRQPIKDASHVQNQNQNQNQS